MLPDKVRHLLDHLRVALMPNSRSNNDMLHTVRTNVQVIHKLLRVRVWHQRVVCAKQSKYFLADEWIRGILNGIRRTSRIVLLDVGAKAVREVRRS